MSNLFKQIIDKNNAEDAYRECMKGKCKFKADSIRFDRDKTANVNLLLDELERGAYQPGSYFEFRVYEPKERIVLAPKFRDKLVQRMVYNLIKEEYKPVFISDSYACIEDKGTHKASAKTAHVMRKAKWMYGPETFVIKLDISKFFYSVDKSIMKSLLRKTIKCHQTLGLLDRIIDSSPGGVGLPLGNITSHTFANIYLNELDQFCKRCLGLKFYVRYMDDICAVVPDRETARLVLERMVGFLNGRLLLNINPKKTKIFPVAQGVNFVGFKTYVTHKLLRNQTKKKVKRKLRKMPRLIKEGYMTTHKAEQMLNSWLGHSMYACSRNFIRSLISRNSHIEIKNKLFRFKEKTTCNSMT